MATNRTFTMIKPDAVENGHIGGILNMITEGGFRIVSLKLTQLTVADAQAFYAVHEARPFFGELVEFMTRGPIVAAILEKENAVEDFRTLIGATNPADAAEGTRCFSFFRKRAILIKLFQKKLLFISNWLIL